MPPLIANFSNAGPTGSTSLAEALAKTGAEVKDFADMTGSTNLAGLLKTEVETAEKARADALGKAQSLATSAMQHATDLEMKRLELGAKAAGAMTGNPAVAAGAAGAAGGGGAAKPPASGAKPAPSGGTPKPDGDIGRKPHA
jgi:hypothetical protein